MAALSAPTIGDLLEDGIHLDVYCHQCGRHVRIAAAQAVAMLGARCTLPAAARRLTCSACGWPGRDGKISARPCTLDRDDVRHGLPAGHTAARIAAKGAGDG